jgi:N-acetylmuramoyl-L-alanine amidase
MRGPIGTHWQIHEKDITLAVAKKLAAALRARGVDVIMTRTFDTLIALSDRGRIANEQHGDVFVSVHVNAAPIDWKRPGDTKGYETYFLAEAKTEDARRVERMENESIHFETGAASKQGDAMNFIINDMAQNEHLRESSELASIVQERLGEASAGPSRGVFQAGFRVLVTAYMPAVLVEIGFGTNKDEAKLLDNNAYQKRIAASIADATIEYLNHYEQRVSGTGKPATKNKGDASATTKIPPRR